jgi:hypothetical protein
MALGSNKHDAPRADEGKHGIKTENNRSASIGMRYLFAATTLIIVGAAGFLVIFIVSVLALQGIYHWYPQFVAQQWFVYDQLFTTFSFLGLLSGLLATALILSKRNPTIALFTALLSTVSGASVCVTSLIAPLAVLWRSVLYYFLPLFIAPLIGTLIFYHVKLNYINHR